MKIKKNKILFEKGLIILFMISYFIPNFFAFDRIGNQWLYLSIITVVSFFYLLFYDNLYVKLKKLIIQKDVFFYLLFILWAIASILYSLNRAEALVTVNQYITVFCCYIMLIIITTHIPSGIDFLLNIFLILLFFEVFLSIYPIFKDIEKSGIVFRSMQYSGAAANINITSFSLLYKTPILFYFIIVTKGIKKIFLYVTFYLLLLIISILGTRGAFIGVLICYISFIIYLFFLNKNFSFKIKHFAVIIGILLISISTNIGLSNFNSNVLTRASSINLKTEDGSVNQRLRYYKQGLSHFLKNPLIGVGIGNWKLKSIEYDKEDIEGFIVPYHAHNDLIQILTELGLFGLISYLVFIFLSIKNVFIFKLFENKINYLFLGSLSVYALDSMLNFPIARPISQLFMISFFCMISLYGKKYND